jgi:hypothetical protein
MCVQARCTVLEAQGSSSESRARALQQRLDSAAAAAEALQRDNVSLQQRLRASDAQLAAEVGCLLHLSCS